MKSISAEITALHTLYFYNYGNKLRLEEIIDGETSVFLFGDNIGKGMTIWAGRKPTKSSMKQGIGCSPRNVCLLKPDGRVHFRKDLQSLGE